MTNAVLPYIIVCAVSLTLNRCTGFNETSLLQLLKVSLNRRLESLNAASIERNKQTKKRTSTLFSEDWRGLAHRNSNQSPKLAEERWNSVESGDSRACFSQGSHEEG